MLRRTVAGRLAVAAGAIAVVAPTVSAQAAGQQLMCHKRIAKIVGTNGPDVIDGTSNRDVIVGRGGDDLIHGRGGDDIICGDGGQSTPGNDRLFGDSGRDLLDGQPGRDRLHGGGGNDLLLGGRGKDILSGVAGRDRLSGGSGNDQMKGGSGDDRLDGGTGSNTCDGGDGTDGGVQCLANGSSIALLSFQSVSLHRALPGGINCDLNVVIINQGSESATDVEVEGTVKTTIPPTYGAEPLLHGSAEIAANNSQFYTAFLAFPFLNGDHLKYVVRVHNGGTSVDTASSEFGIQCSG